MSLHNLKLGVPERGAEQG